jgi:replicative DNA helicase
VSLAQIGVDFDGSSGPPRSPGEAFDRTPPQDVLAEQSVLGGMMLSKDAIADVVETLRGADFYRPAHETVFEAILDLYGRGEPADAVTVADELTKRGDLTRIGGAAYLHTLISGVPTAANAGYYAQIVRERAILRRLVEAGTRIVQLGYAATGGDVDDLVNAAQSEVSAVTERRTSEDYLPIGAIIEGTVDEIEAAGHRDGTMAGVPTGFADLDRLTHGLHPGQMIVLAARPAIGKCLAAGSMVTDAYTGRRMTVAEFVDRGRSGEPLAIHTLDERWRLGVAEPTAYLDNGVREVFKLRLRSGRAVTATANHPLRTLGGWVPLEHLDVGDRIAVPRVMRVGADDPSPYSDAFVSMVGLLLGDGCLTAATPQLAVKSPAIAAEAAHCAGELGVRANPRAYRPCNDSEDCELDNRQVRDDEGGHCHPTGLSFVTSRAVANPLTGQLRALGLMGLGSYEKHVPSELSSLPNRQISILLSRLFATDGWASIRWQARRSTSARAYPIAEIGYCSVNERLARDVQHLLLRLGILSDLRRKKVAHSGEDRWAWQVTMHRGEEIRRFCDEVGILSKESRCAEVRAAIDQRTTDVAGLDSVPGDVWDLVEKAKGERSWGWVSRVCGLPSSHNWHNAKRQSLSRRRLALLGEATGEDALLDLAWSDVLWDEVVAVDPAGFERVYDLTVDGTHNFVADDVIVHNSTLGLDIARSASIKHGMTSVIFSLEMSRTEITMRLLSAEARIPLQKLRQGKLDDSDWTKMARTMGELTDAPLFIDDSPNMSLMEIRAKCRRLKQRHDLKLVIIDYLQLMQSGKRVESRQQEVSEFSRALKLLAKELEVPVIAISQLNRGAEARTDKKPLMSDLRESGCLTADTRVLRADTGAETTLGALYASGAQDVPVWSLDDSLRYVRRHLTHVFPTGIRPVFRVELASGKSVRATANHPFLTYEGWSALESLRPGSRVGVPRHVPAPESMTVWDDSKVAAAAETLAEELQGVSRTALGVPSPVASLPKQQITAFLRHLWSIAGSVSLDESGDRGRVRLCGVRRAGLENVARLLLRFGISSRLETVEDSAVRNDPADGSIGAADWGLAIEGLDDQRRFLAEIGVYGQDCVDAMLLLDEVRRASAPMPQVELASQRVWDSVHEVLLAEVEELAMAGAGAAAATGVGSGGGGGAGGLGGPGGAPGLRRQPMGRVAELLERADLEVDAVNDLLWDRVVSIVPDGVEQVFDATVIGTHNFIADGIAVHNSIEQDADMVILLHREDAYERESPRAGEADFIVAKHRNGPTDTITVAFQGHYSRFVDMAST